MVTAQYRRLESFLRDSAFAELETELARADLETLAELWPQFGALNKLVLFKLMDAARAMELYARLSLKEKYYLLCGFSLQSIAPVLEGLKPAERARFVQLPRKFYDRMFKQIVSERVEITFPLNKN